MFKCLKALFATVVGDEDMYMWKMKCQFLYFWNVILLWNYFIDVSSNTSSFSVNILAVLSELVTVDTMNMLFICGMNISH